MAEQRDYFLLISADAEIIDGGKRDAFDISQTRLKRGLWPLYTGTRHRGAIGAGDICVIYIAGAGAYAQHFVAYATVGSVLLSRAVPQKIDDDALLTDVPQSVIAFDHVQMLNPAVPIRPLVHALAFLPSTTSQWGIGLQGGCRRISREDMLLIVRDWSN